ncbi:MAG: 50S ribosomal protein L11 methyltransferase [Ruminococcaceae bacterium]|nr:50S ribosomal protein L11 methyltransferase [Oscillospiraceae bacterium]
MDWTDIIIKISSEDVDAVSAIAQMVVSRGIYIEDYSTFDSDIEQFGYTEVIDEVLLAKDRTTALVHIYTSPEENPKEAVSFLAARLDAEKIEYSLEMGNVKEEDWANNWKQYFKPMKVGEKLLLCPTWEAENIGDEMSDRIKLLIDPGMAFGSGQHETTKLCMELIEKYITPDTNMLDVGTGSGILGIAGLLLGAGDVTGVDIDALSVKVAKENAEINGVGDKFNVKCGNLADDISGKFNMITANIVADIIVMLMPDAKKLLSDDGIFIMSGIIDMRFEDVEKGLAENNFEIIEVKRERGWCAITAKHKEI